MLVQITLAAAGLALLTIAADHLVLGSSRLARRLRINAVVVGVIVIGLGTSAPELLVSAVAAARGDTGIAVGNIVGSNILNLTLILGVAALIGPMAITSKVLRREVPLAVCAVGLFAALAWAGLGRTAGAVLATATLGALALLLRWARTPRGNQELAEDVATFTEDPAVLDLPTPGRRPPGWFEPIRSAAGLAGVLAGAQLLVSNAAAIAADLGASQVLIGFTIVAVGTSLPELVTTVQAQRRGESELLVGNLFGSNLFNSLAGGAVIGFASGTGRPATAGAALLLTMLLSSGLAWVLLRRGLRLTRPEGAVLLATYVLTLLAV
ncbi:calcium/sodium antiporter [Phytohabitans sp. LJ34]|uniref:calcium/sodium antiporter n=1 Tax=Phytohabitans sp. LJ34 TaxID=3452217 RepID=UPI003F8A0904